MSVRFVWLLVCLSCSFLMTGCGVSKGPQKEVTSGSVSYNGEPIKKGMIRFIPAEGPPVQTEIVDGQYRVDYKGGVAVGRAKVEIDGFKETGKMIKISPESSIPESIKYIPAKYNESTRLSVEITQGGPNSHDFDLPK